jgi:pentatricopeptide repeat protein
MEDEELDEWDTDPLLETGQWDVDGMDSDGEGDEADLYDPQASLDTALFGGDHDVPSSDSGAASAPVRPSFGEHTAAKASFSYVDTADPWIHAANALELDEEHASQHGAEFPDGHESTDFDELTLLLKQAQLNAASGGSPSSSSSSSSGRRHSVPSFSEDLHAQGQCTHPASRHSERSFVHMLLRSGKLRRAVAKLAEISEQEDGLGQEDLYTFHELIRAAGHRKQLRVAITAYALLRAEPNIQPDPRTFTLMIDACAHARRYHDVATLMDDMAELGYEARDLVMHTSPHLTASLSQKGVCVSVCVVVVVVVVAGFVRGESERGPQQEQRERARVLSVATSFVAVCAFFFCFCFFPSCTAITQN